MNDYTEGRNIYMATAANATERPPSNDDGLIDTAHHLVKARALLTKHISRQLVRDSVWDMLLELYISDFEERSVCVKQLMLATEETSTTAMRLIDRLDQAGFIERVEDERDLRRTIVRLSAEGHRAVTACLEAITPQLGEPPKAGR